MEYTNIIPFFNLGKKICENKSHFVINFDKIQEYQLQINKFQR